MTATAYRAGQSEAVATQSFTYTPAQPAAIEQNMTLGTFGKAFELLETVVVAYTPTTTAVLLLDNVVGSLVS